MNTYIPLLLTST